MLPITRQNNRAVMRAAIVLAPSRSFRACLPKRRGGRGRSGGEAGGGGGGGGGGGEGGGRERGRERERERERDEGVQAISAIRDCTSSRHYSSPGRI